MSFQRNDVLISVPPGPVVSPLPPFVDITLARGLFPSPSKERTHRPHSLGSASDTVQADTTPISKTVAVEPKAASITRNAAVESSFPPKPGQALVESTNQIAAVEPYAASITQDPTVESI